MRCSSTVLAVAAFLFMCGCSSNDNNATNAATVDGGGGNGADAATADMAPDLPEDPIATCQGLLLLSDAMECGTCAVECECGETSLTLEICTNDGCIVSADCDAVCAAGLGFAMTCDQTYEICSGDECP